MDLNALLGNGQVGPEIILILLIPLALLVIIIAMIAFGGSGQRMSTRINKIKVHHSRETISTAQLIDARRGKKTSGIPALEELANKILPRREILEMRIARAGMNFSPGVYLIICAVIGTIACLIKIATGAVPLPAAILGGLISGLALPHAFLAFKIRRRQSKFLDHFPEAIELMVRGVKAGLPVAESIKTASQETPEPVKSELSKIVDAIRIGRKLNDVLWETSRRLDLQEFKFFAIALMIQSETGGNLAETLNNLGDVLRGRRQLKLKVKALSSEAKASAYIIGSLPFIMAGLIYLVNAEYIMKLIEDPRGHMMIAAGFASFGIGVSVMYKMVRFEV
jgi:tight adherence protein B